jgi:hypothetical protein
MPQNATMSGFLSTHEKSKKREVEQRRKKEWEDSRKEQLEMNTCVYTISLDIVNARAKRARESDLDRILMQTRSFPRNTESFQKYFLFLFEFLS